MPFTDSIKMVDVVIAETQSLTAVPTDVIAGKQFIGASKHVETGSLVANPVRTDVTIVAGESFNIPYGINPQSYNVIAKGLAEQTSGTAAPENIIDTKTAWVNGEKITGTMVNVGQETETLACDGIHNITRGFHDGSGYVKAKSLREQTMASTVAENIVLGDTCWANGEFITGTMPTNQKATINLDAGQSYTIPVGKHTGEGKVIAKTLAAQTPGNATSYEIVTGYSAWVNGERVYGTMPNNTPETITLPMNGTYNIPNGYHNGSGKVTQSIPSKPGQTVAPTKDAQTIPLAGYYMEGDIIVSGVSGLNYQRPAKAVKDSTGTSVSNYPLSVSSGKAKIKLYVDNWHDNSTYNVYNLLSTNLKDTSDNTVTLDCAIFFDKGTATMSLSSNITINMGMEDGGQYIEFTGINSGSLTMLDNMDLRDFS